MLVPRTLSLEKLAEISVKLELGAPRSRVLGEAGLTSRAWESAKTAWFRRMAEEASRGRRETHERYAELLRALREKASRAPLSITTSTPGEIPAPFVARLSPLSAMAALHSPSPGPSSDTLSISIAAVAAPPSVAMAPDDEGIDTVVLSENDAMAVRNPLPFLRQQGSAEVPAQAAAADLDIARYAAIGAELAVFPEDAAAILERNGIRDAVAWAQVDLAFRARLREPHINDAWLSHYRFYHAHFTAEARKSRP